MVGDVGPGLSLSLSTSIAVLITTLLGRPARRQKFFAMNKNYAQPSKAL
jgi:hypothetical protein